MLIIQNGRGLELSCLRNAKSLMSLSEDALLDCSRLRRILQTLYRLSVDYSEWAWVRALMFTTCDISMSLYNDASKVFQSFESQEGIIFLFHGTPRIRFHLIYDKRNI